MPWEGIEDGDADVLPVWLSREKDAEEWKPIRKVDSRALNGSNPNSTQVLVEGGRATADPLNGVIRYNFYNTPTRKLTSGTWFVREERSGNKEHPHVLTPMSHADAAIVEDLYKKALQASSSLGRGIDGLMRPEAGKEVMLQDDSDFQVIVAKKDGNKLVMMKKKAKSWLGRSYELQRGYGEYTIDGELEETSLGPVTHLVFVVHGIGEALWSRQDNIVLSTLDAMDQTRMTIHKKQYTEWQKECARAKKQGEKPPNPPNRIELLPIEWWDRIHSSSSALKTTLKASTLQTIPALRAIANDVMFDVLMYLTPTFTETVLSTVTEQIQDVFRGYLDLNPSFRSSGGKCSLVGHSLGSVICWDMLSVLKDFSQPKPKRHSHPTDKLTIPRGQPVVRGVSVSSQDGGVEIAYQAYAAASTDDMTDDPVKSATWGPSLTKPMQECLPFVPEVTVFLGSPIGLFLTLRGAHDVFENMLEDAVREAREKQQRRKEQEEALKMNPEAAAAAAAAAVAQYGDDDDAGDNFKTDSPVEPVSSPFTLPSGAIYNIFHPSDPVAYRIEPLLLPRAAGEDALPPPEYLVPRKGQKLRLHVQAKQLGDDLRRSLQSNGRTLSSFFGSVAEKVESVMNAAEEESRQQQQDARKRRASQQQQQGPANMFALGGTSLRVDHQLQTGAIENEYLSAVSAHSSYFVNDDVISFLLDKTVGNP